MQFNGVPASDDLVDCHLHWRKAKMVDMIGLDEKRRNQPMPGQCVENEAESMGFSIDSAPDRRVDLRNEMPVRERAADGAFHVDG